MAQDFVWPAKNAGLRRNAMALRKAIMNIGLQSLLRFGIERGISILSASMVGVAAMNSAAAMEFNVINPDEGRPALSMSGEILLGDTARILPLLIRLSEGNIAPRLYIESPGGSILEATMLANIIHKAGLPVFVEAGDVCASACFLLFAASPSRHASPEAMIGVHSASIDGNENAGSWMVDTAMAREARAFGVPPDVIGQMVTTAPSDMAWLTADELHEMDVKPISLMEKRGVSAAPSVASSSQLLTPLTMPVVSATQSTTVAAPADKPWDGISYIPAEFGANNQVVDPGSPPELELPAAFERHLDAPRNTRDYIPQGIFDGALPAYTPGR